jgi:NADH-ubiquinone oxidoreductase chain 4
LLKAHVESPLSGSIVLAAIVLKLSLYGIFRLILPILPQISLEFTYIVYTLSVITVIYASLSTLRTIDIKELIAYSSVAHASIYIMGAFSNSVSGIEGSIMLGLGHGLVSSGLFICVGGVLYDRTHTRLITYYRGVAQIMPVFSILFFILCLANAATPLTVNFVGEFLSLYGAIERLPILGVIACSSIVLSAAYTIFMFNRIAFGGALSAHLISNIPDLSKREFVMLMSLVIPTLLFGIYPAPILDGLHYSVSTLIFAFDSVNNLSLISIPFTCLTKRFNYTHNKPLSLYTHKKSKLHTEPKNSSQTSEATPSGLSPNFVTGFTDGDGSFSINFVKTKAKLYPSLFFKIGVHVKDIIILQRIQKFFVGVGKIYVHKDSMAFYNVSSIKDLAVIIEHFTKYPLLSFKSSDFNLFKLAYILISEKKHTSEEGFNKLLSIKAAINKGFSEELKKNFPDPKYIKIYILISILFFFYSKIKKKDILFFFYSKIKKKDKWSSSQSSFYFGSFKIDELSMTCRVYKR